MVVAMRPAPMNPTFMTVSNNDSSSRSQRKHFAVLLHRRLACPSSARRSGEYDVQITPGLRRHRRVGLPEELIQSPLRGGKQACLDVFDGLVCRARHEVGAETYQGFTN